MERLPFTIALTRFMGTRKERASWFRLIPASCRSSLKISPGWIGANRFLCSGLSVVVRDLDIIRISSRNVKQIRH